MDRKTDLEPVRELSLLLIQSQVPYLAWLLPIVTFQTTIAYYNKYKSLFER